MADTDKDTLTKELDSCKRWCCLPFVIISLVALVSIVIAVLKEISRAH